MSGEISPGNGTGDHIDHVAGVTDLVERFDCEVWAHAHTAEQVDFRVDRRLAESVGVFERTPAELQSAMIRAFSPRLWVSPDREQIVLRFETQPMLDTMNLMDPS